MVKGDTSSESEGSRSSRSEESEGVETVGNNAKGVSEYEKQRLRRIADNRARLEALGLPQIASSFMKGSPQIKRKKGKEKVKDDDDEEYRPENEEREGDSASSSSSERDDMHGSDVDAASGSRKRKVVKNKGLKTKGKVSGKRHGDNSECTNDDDKALMQVKNKGLKTKGRVSGKKHGDNSEYTNDDDKALMQAIALSLQGSAEASNCFDKIVEIIDKSEKKGTIHIHEDKGRKKNKKSFTSRLQMTEDELIVHFFQLDEAGKGTVTIRDLERAALAHDFVFTDKELIDMIRCFDSNGDGKLSLDDFRKIVVRCNMIKEPENS